MLYYRALTYWSLNKWPLVGDISEWKFLKENVCIFIQIWPKLFLSPIGHKSVLIQVMAGCWTRNKPFTVAMMILFTDAYMCHQGAMCYVYIFTFFSNIFIQDITNQLQTVLLWRPVLKKRSIFAICACKTIVFIYQHDIYSNLIRSLLWYKTAECQHHIIYTQANKI